MNERITRRSAVKRLLGISGTVAFSALTEWPFWGLGDVWTETAGTGFIVEGHGRTRNYSVKELINVPIAKDHGLSTLTLGIKNWIGGVGGRRYTLHQDIHQTIVDLAQFFKPTVTLIDATRILVSNGPSGGSTSDVMVKNALILSDDQVTADTLTAGLFEIRAEDLGFIRLGEKVGLGTSDLGQLNRKKVTI